MWRRFFLVVLWAGGTAGATGVVFYAVSQMSSDLASVNRVNADRPVPRAGSATTVVDEPTSTGATTAESTVVDEPTVPTDTEVPTTPPLLTVPEGEPATGAATSTPAPGTTRAPTVTTRAPSTGTTVSTQAPPETTAPPVATTPAPPPPTTPPPTTPPPATTIAQLVCSPYVHPVKRVGTVSVRACTDGIHFVTASVANATWSATPLAFGPPSVTVRFTGTGGTTYTCTLSGTEGVTASGDC